MSSCYRLRSLGLLLVISLMLGCSPTPESTDTSRETVARYRAQMLLPEEPAGAVGILELRARMEGTDIAESLDEHGHEAHEQHDARTHQGEPHDVPGAEVGAAADLPQERPDETSDLDLAGPEQGDQDADQPSSVPALQSVTDVIVVGKIGKQASQDGVETSDFPWERGVAAFVIVDPAAEGEVAQHEHHAGEECPFCAKKKIEAQAVVQFVDNSYAPIRIDARELLGLKLNDIVVVCGDAKLLGGVLMIDADQLYIRR